MAERFILFQVVIIVPFVLGIIVKRRWEARDLGGLTKRLIRFNLIGIEPVIALWTTWGLVLDRELLLLPLSGLFIVLVGLAFGRVFLGLLGLSGKRGATFLIHSTLANHGFTMGSFLCYLLAGEQGLGLAFIFTAYFMPFAFLVIFPYARRQSTGHPLNFAFVWDFLRNLQNMPLLAVAMALVFLAMGWKRPALAVPIDVFLVISIALYYFALGVNFALPAFFTSGRENVVLAAIKFVLVPGVVLLGLKLLPLSAASETVILIQSFMPAAVYSVVSSVLFDLDAGFASNLFVWNMLVFLLTVLPLLLLFRSTLLGLVG